MVLTSNGCYSYKRGTETQRHTWEKTDEKGGRNRTDVSTSHVVAVQLPSRVRLFATPWTAARQASLSLTISWSLPKFMSIELVMPSNRLILCRTFLLLPSIFPSIGVFPVSWPFASGSQSIGASASASHGKPNVASKYLYTKRGWGVFLVAQWLRIFLLVQGIWVQSLIW